MYGTFMIKTTTLYYFYQKFTKFIITHSFIVFESLKENNVKGNNLTKQTFTSIIIISNEQFTQCLYCSGHAFFKEPFMVHF